MTKLPSSTGRRLLLSSMLTATKVLDMDWRWSREHGQKFSLWPTPITNTCLDAGLLRGLVFKSYSPLSAFLCSQSALMDACSAVVNCASLRTHFKSRLSHLFEDLFCKWELGQHMKCANCLFSAREQSVLYQQEHVLLEGFKFCTGFKMLLWPHLHTMTSAS